MTDVTWMKLMNKGARLGCHQRADRSFFLKGYQMPVCARCTGAILSSILAMITFFFIKIPKRICVVLSGIMFFDWVLQKTKIRESTNKRRLITGLIGGYGYTTLHMYFIRWLYKLINIK